MLPPSLNMIGYGALLPQQLLPHLSIFTQIMERRRDAISFGGGHESMEAELDLGSLDQLAEESQVHYPLFFLDKCMLKHYLFEDTGNC